MIYPQRTMLRSSSTWEVRVRPHWFIYCRTYRSYRTELCAKNTKQFRRCSFFGITHAGVITWVGVWNSRRIELFQSISEGIGVITHIEFIAQGCEEGGKLDYCTFIKNYCIGVRRSAVLRYSVLCRYTIWGLSIEVGLYVSGRFSPQIWALHWNWGAESLAKDGNEILGPWYFVTHEVRAKQKT